MRKPSQILSFGLSLLLLAGCAKGLKNDDQVDAILAAYEAQQQTAKVAGGESVQRLEVISGGDGPKVRGRLQQAERDKVLPQLLADAGLAWSLDQVVLHGRVDVEFVDTPLQQAVKILLDGQGLEAEFTTGMVHIRAPSLTSDSAAPQVYAVVELEHIDSEHAALLLAGLYDSKNNKLPISFGASPEASMIYLSGREDIVLQARQLLARADQPQKHVVIEALVADYSVGDLKALGGKLLGLASGEFSDVAINYSNIGEMITFSQASGESRSLSFKGVINLMISDNQARVISRPYVVTMSGKPALFQVAGERYILTTNSSGSSTTKVDAGVSLNITPTVLNGNRIRLVLKVEDSIFSGAGAGVEVATSRNLAESIVQVDSGQTLVIGGMTRNSHSRANSGFPLLRQIPGVNLLFSRTSDDYIRKEVIMLLTPHVWEPGMEAPLVAPEAMDYVAPELPL